MQSRRGFDENVKVDIVGQMAEHSEILCTCIFSGLQWLFVTRSLEAALPWLCWKVAFVTRTFQFVFFWTP